MSFIGSLVTITDNEGTDYEVMPLISDLAQGGIYYWPREKSFIVQSIARRIRCDKDSCKMLIINAHHRDTSMLFLMAVLADITSKNPQLYDRIKADIGNR